jgi:hypothetical protein
VAASSLKLYRHGASLLAKAFGVGFIVWLGELKLSMTISLLNALELLYRVGAVPRHLEIDWYLNVLPLAWLKRHCRSAAIAL